MRVFLGCATALALAFSLSAGPHAQGGAPAAPQGGPGGGAARGGGGRQASGGPDAARVIPGGGVFVSGWTGKVDTAEVTATQQVLNNSKLSMEGNAMHVETGPATTYWNPANRATGNYTVKATFTEPKYMNANSHAHPYGIMIAGNDLGTNQQSYVYCSAYGNGNFIVRVFGPSDNPAQDTVVNMNGRGGANDAVHKAAGPGQPVTQEIAMSVKADSVTCTINGTEVASYPKSDLVQAGRLKSTDGVYGIRFSHNTDATVTGLTMTKQ